MRGETRKKIDTDRYNTRKTGEINGPNPAKFVREAKNNILILVKGLTF